MDKIEKIMAYEGGELNDKDTLRLFAELIKSGQAWALQRHYGRTASALIQDNWISKLGVVNWKKVKQNEIK